MSGVNYPLALQPLLIVLEGFRPTTKTSMMSITLSKRGSNEQNAHELSGVKKIIYTTEMKTKQRRNGYRLERDGVVLLPPYSLFILLLSGTYKHI